MNVLHFSALIALACISTFHAILVFVMFDEVTFRVVWYLGMDMGVAAGIAVNVLAARGGRATDPISWRICHGVNLLLLAFGIFYLVVVPGPGPALAVVAGAILTQRKYATEA
ncbi:MAG: hypothetical protein FJX59_12295 [Alphaproteobacteria bacterium]|nr:hypothetical protein [Alphaproteobacteria bacterium]